ncbi:MAG TPA: hypothetical protein VF661_11800 [Actinomycetales bacterium]|jgi:hypothetical protein
MRRRITGDVVALVAVLAVLVLLPRFSSGQTPPSAGFVALFAAGWVACRASAIGVAALWRSRARSRG